MKTASLDSGIISGAAAIFFAYVGFDAVSKLVKQSILKDVPFAIIVSLLVCTIFLHISIISINRND
jgi:APA family basic amino acid/polyamine antiporter